jgi:hypothetical protein
LRLVDHDPATQRLEGRHRLGETSEIRRRLQIEVVGIPASGELARQSGLAALARAEQHHDRIGTESPLDRPGDSGTFDRFHRTVHFEH